MAGKNKSEPPEPVSFETVQQEWDKVQQEIQQRRESVAQTRTLSPRDEVVSSRDRSRASSSFFTNNRPTDRLPGILKQSAFPMQRVAQLDAQQIDEEVELLLSEQIKRALRYFPASRVQFWKPETLLVLRCVLFRASMWNYSTTYGQRLQNLTYRAEQVHSTSSGISPTLTSPFSEGRHAALKKWQLYAYVLLWIGGRYGIERLNWYCAKHNWADEPEQSWKRQFWVALRWVEKVTKLLDFVNMLAFLWNGRYVMLVERLLRMRLVPGMRSLPRQVNFEFMNRQLVWQSFAEFLLFLLPIVNMNSIKKLFRRLWTREQRQVTEGTCPICLKSPVNTPYVPENCDHVYCYYCLSSALEEDSKFSCLCCNRLCGQIRWQHT